MIDDRRHTVTLIGVILFCTAMAVHAQTTVEVQGRVAGPTGEGLADVAITADDGSGTSTGHDGRFKIRLSTGPRVLFASHPDWATLRYEVVVGPNSQLLELQMTSRLHHSETITVSGIRAEERSPVTKTDIQRNEIESNTYGQDTPSLLQHTPGVTWYSDSGGGSNYSYFSLRGIQQTRINVTLDGAPLNDPAEHALYFNNIHDFTSMVDSIQIQRGVGTSTVGAPSYGGSVNFASTALSPERETEVSLGVGSFDTTRASAAFQTGELSGGLSLHGRVSYQSTDGYRDHSGGEHHTLFLNAGWHAERSQWKFVSFSGSESTQLSYLAVEPEILKSSPTFNPLDEDETDHFGQDFAQLQYTRLVGDHDLFQASVYYNAAEGWFRLWADPVAKSDLLQFGIDQHFVGSMVSYQHSTAATDTTVGLHYNDFAGDHTLRLGNERLYLNTGFKKTLNAFAKSERQVGAWLLFGDLQFRWAEFEYAGAVDLGSVDWSFVDPRLGIRYDVTPGLSLYGSIGKAEREPSRLDLLAGEDDATAIHDLEGVRAERVVDIEAGADFRTRKLVVHANFYSMRFNDEIALTGELSDIGLPLRRNVDESSRQGFEIDIRWRMSSRLTLTHTANLSHNSIRQWIQYFDVYDVDGNWVDNEPRSFRNVPPLLTPEIVINQGIEWSSGGSTLAVIGRYVDESYLDNTGDDRFRTPSWFNLDLRGSMRIDRWLSAGQPTLRLFVNNLFDDTDQYASGYSYQFINRDPAGPDAFDGIPFYYPLAGRHAVLSLDFKL